MKVWTTETLLKRFKDLVLLHLALSFRSITSFNRSQLSQFRIDLVLNLLGRDLTTARHEMPHRVLQVWRKATAVV